MSEYKVTSFDVQNIRCQHIYLLIVDWKYYKQKEINKIIDTFKYTHITHTHTHTYTHTLGKEQYYSIP